MIKPKYLTYLIVFFSLLGCNKTVSSISSDKTETTTNNILNYCYSEFYSQEYDEYIRLYENSYFQYDSKDGSFVNHFSTNNDYVVVSMRQENQDLFIDSFSELYCFEIKNDTMRLNNELSIIKGESKMDKKVFALSKTNGNSDATYRYSMQKAENLIIRYSFMSTLDTKEDILNELGLDQYTNRVKYFENNYAYGSLKFVFPLQSNNVESLIKTFIEKSNNEIVRNVSYCFDDYAITKSVNLDNIGLTNDCLFNNYSDLSSFVHSNRVYCDGYPNDSLCFESRDEILRFTNELQQRNSKTYSSLIDYLVTFSEDVFESYNIVLSSEVLLEDSSTSCAIKNMYLKDQNLYLVLEKTRSGSASYQVVSYASFAFKIDKKIDYQSFMTVF